MDERYREAMNLIAHLNREAAWLIKERAIMADSNLPGDIKRCERLTRRIDANTTRYVDALARADYLRQFRERKNA